RGCAASRIASVYVDVIARRDATDSAVVVQRVRSKGDRLRVPMPGQSAALFETLEAMPKEQWPTLLRAANSTDLSVRISDVPPDDREPAWHEAPVVDFILRRYISVLGDREVRVRVEPSSEELAGPLKALAWVSPG